MLNLRKTVVRTQCYVNFCTISLLHNRKYIGYVMIGRNVLQVQMTEI